MDKARLAALLFVTVTAAWAVAAVGVVWRRGFLRRQALESAPRRDVALGPLDLALMLAYMALMALMVLLPQLLLKLGWTVQTGATSLTDLPPLEAALSALEAQVIMQLPIVAFIVWRVAGRPDGLRQFGLLPRPRIPAFARDVRLGLAGLAVVWPVMAVVMFAGTQADKYFFHHKANPVAHDLLEVLLKSDSPLATGILMFSAGLAAPVLEETIFRGLLQTAISNMLGWSRRWGVLIGCAVLFAGIHLSVVPWYGLPSLFILGLVLGWLYERSGSLWPGIVAHAGYNLLSMALVLAGVMGKPEA